jgi:hypothetical protein
MGTLFFCDSEIFAEKPKTLSAPVALSANEKPGFLLADLNETLGSFEPQFE